MTANMRGITFPARRAKGESISLVELILAVGPWILGPKNWRIGDCEFSSGSRGSTELAQLANSQTRISTLKLVDLVADEVQLIDGEIACLENGSDVPFLALTSVRGDDWDVYSTEPGLLEVVAKVFPGWLRIPVY